MAITENIGFYIFVLCSLTGAMLLIVGAQIVITYLLLQRVDKKIDKLEKLIARDISPMVVHPPQINVSNTQTDQN